ncbi:MAG TPA: CCA tRNA nucleotidyltransferase, partial [Candidatus Saccharimonadales bacterium]|nr:CCA tRNA nucleotidyltransferase [Candidatus Saccharimonadales bacterium]
MGFAPKWLHDLGEAFDKQGFELFLVGGAIRNKLLGLKIGEWDCATSAHPGDTERILRGFGCKKIGLVGKRFGTITGEFQGEKLEVTTFRSEKYDEASRQPTVEYGKTIEEDLSRRDFTINAVAYNLKTEKLLDPEHGQDDLKKGVVRAVGIVADRFKEDPLRMLRAVRFATLLDFEIDQATLTAITHQKDRFAILSAERISQEMDKMLLANQPSRGIVALVETGLISYILPELIPAIDLEFDPHEHKDIYRHILQVLDNTPPKIELRWVALLHDLAKPI